MTETAKSHNVTVDVVNMTSIGAHFIIPKATAYQTSKLALTRFSELVVEEYGDQGVNCLALHPGGVSTGIMKDDPIPFILAGMPMPRTLHRCVGANICRSIDRYSRPLRRICCVAHERAEGLAERAVRERDVGRGRTRGQKRRDYRW